LEDWKKAAELVKYFAKVLEKDKGEKK